MELVKKMEKILRKVWEIWKDAFLFEGDENFEWKTDGRMFNTGQSTKFKYSFKRRNWGTFREESEENI